VAIFKVFWSLLSVKTLKLPSPKVATESTLLLAIKEVRGKGKTVQVEG